MHNGQSQPVTIELPLPDGSFQTFQIFEAPVMHPELAAKFPSIQSYAGHCVSDPTTLLRADLSQRGFHAMILDGKTGTSFIDPVPDTGGKFYQTHFKKHSQHNGSWACHSESDGGPKPGILAAPNALRSPDCKLRTFRLALACTGEYAQFHGGTPADALAAMVTTLTRVNAIFERDLSVTFQLVPNNDALIFLNHTADPYTNNHGGTMLHENQSTCDGLIGEGNYDLGHVLSTGGGGIAYVGSVCLQGKKAGGVTGSSYPEGDAFDIDYVAHELGHQLGANHTQNNACNRYGATAVEPGSGSTVMSYAGVCSPNVQLHSDAYFHAVSIGEIKNKLAGTGGSCASATVMNSCPEADAGPGFSLPAGTPFCLQGTGWDADSDDALTYTWEQIDNQPAQMPPASSNTIGPAFRSLPPSTDGRRFFPKLEDLLAGNPSQWEVLPSQGRSLNFRLTVRDNHPGGGCVGQDDVTLTLVSGTGPFRITSPGDAANWTGGSAKNISWDVAGSNLPPVGCQSVDILLSADGGRTWPLLLAQATDNDGSQTVQVPNIDTDHARIMVRSVGNIFFAVSANDLTIQQSAEFSVHVSTTEVSCHGGKDGSASLSATGGTGNYTFHWTNGSTSPTLENLPTGSYRATVSDGFSNREVTAQVGQPELLKLNLGGTNATQGSNGSVSAILSGGTAPFSYLWNTGSTQPTLMHVPAANYVVTVTDANGCTASGQLQLQGAPPLPFEHGVLEAVGEQWQLVELKNDYDSPVVVASIEVPDNSIGSVVSRVQMVSGSAFVIRTQAAGNGSVRPVRIHYIVAEEGQYTLAQHGVAFEAVRVLSQKTSRAGNWRFEPQFFQNDYKNPVVLGQVMSQHDSRWSAFWASRHGKRGAAPTANSFAVGKHTGEDPDSDRNAEELGYFVFEAGSGFINGNRFLASVGSDQVRGISNALNGYAYPLEGFAQTQTAIVSMAGMQDDEGAWPVLHGSSLTASTLGLSAMEDQAGDAERNHPSERVAYLVLGEALPQNAEGQPGESSSEQRPDLETQVSAYPNPTNGMLTLAFFQTTACGPDLKLTDLLGRVHLDQTLLFAEPGIRAVQLDLTSFPVGQYVLQVVEGNLRRTVKVMRF